MTNIDTSFKRRRDAEIKQAADSDNRGRLCAALLRKPEHQEAMKHALTRAYDLAALTYDEHTARQCGAIASNAVMEYIVNTHA
ncbi:MAG: hypothetical protein HRU20_14565 [Pseudomonadales bacterium]|nr:hypothetical protein [Pseudomonadales bacterium]